MRLPEYLSPTSVKLFYDDIETFYQRYLSDNRFPRDPQTQPMSIGSSFDAFVKSYLHEKLYGKGFDPRYDLTTLFEAQVEKHNRDWAWENGEYLFNCYKTVGCLADLLLELQTAIGPPRFEFDLRGDVEGVPLLGKPDIFFISKEGARVIYDWKVNGYCSNSLKSPMPGYLKLRENVSSSKGGNVGDYKSHKDCTVMNVGGIDINIGMFLEQGDEGWAAQLSIYGWLLGEPVGSDQLITGIEQITGPKGRLRFATHRCRVSQDYQFALLNNITSAWDIILSDWIFRDMSEEDSKKRQSVLDNEFITDSAFDELTRQ